MAQGRFASRDRFAVGRSTGNIHRHRIRPRGGEVMIDYAGTGTSLRWENSRARIGRSTRRAGTTRVRQAPNVRMIRGRGICAAAVATTVGAKKPLGRQESPAAPFSGGGRDVLEIGQQDLRRRPGHFNGHGSTGTHMLVTRGFPRQFDGLTQTQLAEQRDGTAANAPSPANIFPKREHGPHCPFPFGIEHGWVTRRIVYLAPVQAYRKFSHYRVGEPPTSRAIPCFPGISAAVGRMTALSDSRSAAITRRSSMLARIAATPSPGPPDRVRAIRFSLQTGPFPHRSPRAPLARPARAARMRPP